MTKSTPEPFVVRYYTEDHNPVLKGNGFDGLVLGHTLREAEEFVNWVNAALGLNPEWDNVNDPPCHPSDEDWSGCVSCFANRPVLAVAFRAAAQQLLNPLLEQLADQLEASPPH
jgi:hypothetical protein